MSNQAMPRNDGMNRSAMIALVCVSLLGMIIGALIARAIPDPEVEPVDAGGIDAGPAEREIAERLDGALQQVDENIETIEREYGELTDVQREKYDDVREQGPEAVARWMSDFVRSRRDGGR